MLKTRISALIILTLGLLFGFFVFSSENNTESSFAFKYGLDLDGGTHLTYRADVSEVASEDINNSLDSLRRTIERRINVFGVSEPIIQIEKGGAFSSEEDQHRLIVELPGVTDVSEAIDAIGKTPVLEFRVEGDEPFSFEQSVSISDDESEEGAIDLSIQAEDLANQIYNSFKPTGLGGGQLDRASVVFGNLNSEATVSLDFNKEGSDLLAEVTKNNVGKVMAIFIDKNLIQSPVIRQEINGGVAQITGSFTPEEARQLAQDLNFGALPLPIELIETQTIGASLGHDTLNSGVRALVYAFTIVFIFLIIWYRLPGLIAIISLILYIAIMLALFKVIPVTLTSSGLAGFILSLGMAVDANILIFERIKEEISHNHSLNDSVREGFKRAWLPIRDGNMSSIISAIVLFWLSDTSLIKGFALVFGLGVLISMLTAVAVSRTFLLAISNNKKEGVLVKLFGSGLNFSKEEK